VRLKIFMREKRSSRRISHLCEVFCEGEGVTRHSSRITDLSRTGAFIDSMTQFSVGSVLQIKFRAGAALFEARAEVRYVMPQVGMGVQFVDLTPEQDDVLDCLVEGRPVPVLDVQREAESDAGPRAQSDRLHGQNILSGNFAVLSLFDIIQMIENTRLTGALRITLPSESGEIQFNDGHIVGAKSGKALGLSALNKFLGVTEGEFEFKKSATGYKRYIFGTSNTALILDLLRTKDEENAETSADPQVH
jgi:uncharacterized protein DUF4388/PilZ domain-containing protein